jgi:hypothetical protein
VVELRDRVIDIGAYFAGHEPCSGGGEWVRFVGLINSAVRDGSFHPLQGGQAMMPGWCPATSPSSRSPSRRERRPPSMGMTGCIGRETAEVVESTQPAAETS